MRAVFTRACRRRQARFFSHHIVTFITSSPTLPYKPKMAPSQSVAKLEREKKVKTVIGKSHFRQLPPF